MEDRVFAHEALDLRLHVGTKRVPGGAQIGKLGLAADRRNDVREQHGQRARHLAERGVRMPQPVAERIEAALIVLRAQLVRGGEIRDVGELGVLKSLLDTVIPRRFDVAEQAAETEKVVVVEALAGKDQHRMAAACVLKCRDLIGCERREIDTGDFGGEQRMDLAHADHGSAPRSLAGAMLAAAAGQISRSAQNTAQNRHPNGLRAFCADRALLQPRRLRP